MLNHLSSLMIRVISFTCIYSGFDITWRPVLKSKSERSIVRCRASTYNSYADAIIYRGKEIYQKAYKKLIMWREVRTSSHVRCRSVSYDYLAFLLFFFVNFKRWFCTRIWFLTTTKLALNCEALDWGMLTHGRLGDSMEILYFYLHKGIGHFVFCY
jgi:hypothetical protein